MSELALQLLIRLLLRRQMRILHFDLHLKLLNLLFQFLSFFILLRQGVLEILKLSIVLVILATLFLHPALKLVDEPIQLINLTVLIL